MKKKFVAIIMAASFMAATLLTACGGDAGANSNDASSAGNDAQSDVQDSDAGDMVSDETFAVLQDNYAIMFEYYDLVAKTYNTDEIAANPEIEDVMNQAADVIVQMGEIQQDMLTEEDAVTLNDLIIGIVDVLNSVVGEMEPAEGGEGTPVSDETFGILQENWSTLTNYYNEVATAYNNGDIEQNDDFENLMNQAADILEQIQVISRDELTEENAVAVNDTMIEILDAMQAALGVTE